METSEVDGEQRSNSPPEEEDRVIGPKERTGVFSNDYLEMWLEKKFRKNFKVKPDESEEEGEQDGSID